MGYPLRYIPPEGALVEITNRTVQGHHLLRPSAEFNEVFLGILGRAQRRTGVEVHFFVVLSNHVHLLVSVDSAQQLSAFSNYLFGNLGRAVCRLVDWSDKVWAKRYRSITITEERLAQLERLRYLVSNSCKEGLVSSPLEWPGPHAAKAFGERETKFSGIWENRTALYRARLTGRKVDPNDYREVETVYLTPLPCWSNLSEENYTECVLQLIRDVEEETSKQHERCGTKPLGVAKVLRQHPHGRPPTMERSPALFVHAATQAMRWAYWQAYHQFVAAYRDACERLRETGLPVVFPQGSFLPPGLTAAS